LRTQLRANTHEWLEFMEGLWQPDRDGEGNARE
jgi:hypothetical protein